MRCASPDSVGAYRLDSLPPGRVWVAITCQVIRGRGPTLAHDSIIVTTDVSERDWRVDPTACDRRPVRRVSGVFGGHYTPGFESSEFVPCAADAWFIPGDSLDAYAYDARRAWAEVPGDIASGVGWPRGAPRDEYGNARYYVRWRGTVVGPGHYGHLGVSPFRITVDSVLEIRVPSRRDCR